MRVSGYKIVKCPERLITNPFVPLARPWQAVVRYPPPSELLVAMVDSRLAGRVIRDGVEPLAPGLAPL